LRVGENAAQSRAEAVEVLARGAQTPGTGQPRMTLMDASGRSRRDRIGDSRAAVPRCGRLLVTNRRLLIRTSQVRYRSPGSSQQHYRSGHGEGEVATAFSLRAGEFTGSLRPHWRRLPAAQRAAVCGSRNDQADARRAIKVSSGPHQSFVSSKREPPFTAFCDVGWVKRQHSPVVD